MSKLMFWVLKYVLAYLRGLAKQATLHADIIVCIQEHLSSELNQHDTIGISPTRAELTGCLRMKGKKSLLVPKENN